MKLRNHSDAVNAVRLLVSELGGVSIKCTTGMFRQMDGDRPIRIGEEGTPDVVACVGGMFVGIEVKFSNDDKVNDEQRKKGRAIEAAGGIWVVADFRFERDGIAEVTRAIEKNLQKTTNIIRNWADDNGVYVHQNLVDVLTAEIHT